MLERILPILKERCGLEAPAPIVVGVSGGPDSTCLMHVLHAAGFRLVVAHLDHGLRPESAIEAAAVGAFAASQHLPFVSRRVDVPARAQAAHESVEETGRRVRYEFLFEQAHASGAVAVAVGHTADDQVETVLMHIIRGAGLSGLKGMAYRSVIPEFDASIPMVRPLLNEWRRDTVDYCRLHALETQADPSNESLDYFRNRIRNELIPLLESYNPRVRPAILRMAQTLAADHSIVEALVSEVWSEVVTLEQDDLIDFDPAGLRAQATGLRRRVILRAVQRLAPNLDMGNATLESAAAFVEGPGSSQLQLGGGLRLTREPGAVHLGFSSRPLSIAAWPQLSSQPADVPDGVSVRVPLADGWQFLADFRSVEGSALELIPRENDSYRACLDADRLPGGLELRWPRPGDRFQPLGLDGHTKLLSDFFVDAKLPRRARAHWPLLCSGERLVWVPGFRPDEAFKLTAATRRAASFSVSPPAVDD